MRRALQFGFLTLTLLAVFGLGAHAEAWCPMGGVEALYTYWREGNMLCSLGVSNFYILGAVLALTLVARRVFCGYVCPLGTLSEWLGIAARRLGVPQVRVTPSGDRVLGLAKYAVLAAVLCFTWRTGELVFRGFDPCYALISRHGADITHWAYVVAGTLVLASLLFSMPLCRWLCPLAAVLAPFSRFGLARVRRDPSACSHCGRCARACPMAIPVDRVIQVTHAQCLGCWRCIDACRSPERRAAPRHAEASCPGQTKPTQWAAASANPGPHTQPDALRWGPPGRTLQAWPRRTVPLLILGVFAVAVGLAYVVPIPSFVKTRGAPPVKRAAVEMGVEELTCRGRANLLFYYLDRDDLFAVPGYLRLEAWPGPGWSRVRVEYDPAQASDAAIRQAISEAYFDALTGQWRLSPFRIEGYDPLSP